MINTIYLLGASLWANFWYLSTNINENAILTELL